MDHDDAHLGCSCKKKAAGVQLVAVQRRDELQVYFCSLACSKAAALFVSLDALDLLLVGSTVAPTSFFVEEQGGAALESSLHIDGAGVCNRSCFSVFDIALILLYCLSMLLPALLCNSNKSD